MGGFSYVKRKSSLSDYTPQDFFFFYGVLLPFLEIKRESYAKIICYLVGAIASQRFVVLIKKTQKDLAPLLFFFHTVSIESHLPEKKKRKTFFLLMKITEFFSC